MSLSLSPHHTLRREHRLQRVYTRKQTKRGDDVQERVRRREDKARKRKAREDTLRDKKRRVEGRNP